MQLCATTRAVKMATRLGNGRHLGCDVHHMQRVCVLRHGLRLTLCKEGFTALINCCCSSADAREHCRASGCPDHLQRLYCKTRCSICDGDHLLEIVNVWLTAVLLHCR
jgi:hypothetical protein